MISLFSLLLTLNAAWSEPPVPPPSVLQKCVLYLIGTDFLGPSPSRSFEGALELINADIEVLRSSGRDPRYIPKNLIGFAIRHILEDGPTHAQERSAELDRMLNAVKIGLFSISNYTWGYNSFVATNGDTVFYGDLGYMIVIHRGGNISYGHRPDLAQVLVHEIRPRNDDLKTITLANVAEIFDLPPENGALTPSQH